MRTDSRVFSQDRLRRCDLALFLTLFPPDEAEQAGLPVALANQTRRLKMPRGITEVSYLANAVRAKLGEGCIGIGPRHLEDDWREEPLASQLARITALPSVLILPTFVLTGEARNRTLRRLGAPAEAIAAIPAFGPSMPSTIFVQPAAATRARITANGDIVPLLVGDARAGLSVACGSSLFGSSDDGSAAVLDAVLLANWLIEESLDTRFFVSHEVLKWTDTFGVWTWAERSSYDNSDPAAFVDKLRQRFSEIYTRPRVDAIRKFFVERLPTIARTGTTQGWTSLDWSLAPRCQGCRWLGNARWMNDQDRRRVTARPEHYCSSRSGAHA